VPALEPAADPLYPVTRKVTAQHLGQAAIAISSGTLTASVTITVTP
jgi:hypothetical protein